MAFHDPVSLGRLLASLGHPELHVVVVNVEADPQIAQLVHEAGAEHVPLDSNPGYATAVNRGIARCPDGPVVFMNDDVRADAAALSALADVVRRREADVAVPAVKTNEGHIEGTIAALPTPLSLLLECALLPDEPLSLLSRWARVEKWRRPDAPARIDGASAIVVATTTRLLRTVPLPESYFMYWEETEWFWRLHRRGALVQYRPDVIVIHGGGRADVRAEKSRLLARNAVRCVRRTQGRVAAVVVLPVVVAWNLRLAVVAAVRVARHPGPGHRAVLRARLAGLQASLAAYAEVVRAS